MRSAGEINQGYVWSVTLVAAMGGLLFGYDFVVIGGAKPFYEEYFGLTSPFQIGWAMSSALVGCLLGSLVSGALSDRFGRKRLLVLAAVLFTLSAIGTALAETFSAFVWLRLLGGVGIGLASNLSPMYIAEVAPAASRGKFVAINQLTIVIGILIAQIVNWLIAEPVPADFGSLQVLESWNGQYGWRWMFGAEAFPAMLFLILMWAVPESPRWQVKKGEEEAASLTLKRIGGAEFARRSLEEIKKTVEAENAQVRYGELLEPGLLRILWLGIFLAVFQQWSGINTIFYYAEEIFSAAGYGVSDILFNIVITGSVNLIFTFAAIQRVDHWGRRIFMLIGSAGLATCYLLIGLSYHLGFQGLPVLLLVVAAIAFFASTLGPVTWVLISEIFPNRIRGAAVAIAVFSLWVGCLTLTYTFPLLNDRLGTANTYWLYALICGSGFLLLWRKLPETRGRTLEEIERELVGPDVSK